MKKSICFILSAQTLHALVVMGGVGGGYFTAYRTNENTLVSPFAPGLALQVLVGVEGKDIGIATRWRAGIGGMLNPISSAATGDMAIYIVSLPMWLDYPIIRAGNLFLYCGFSMGPGFGIFRNNISGERAQIVTGKASVSLKIETRIFYPSSFWLELKPGALAEFTARGIASTLFVGGEFSAGFTNEY